MQQPEVYQTIHPEVTREKSEDVLTRYPDMPPYIYPQIRRADGTIVSYYVQLRIRCRAISGGNHRTLEEAKLALADLLAKHPEHTPKPENYRQNKGALHASKLLSNFDTDDDDHASLPR